MELLEIVSSTKFPRPNAPQPPAPGLRPQAWGSFFDSSKMEQYVSVKIYRRSGSDKRHTVACCNSRQNFFIRLGLGQ